MSLSTALDTAKSSLAAAQTQTSIISRNIANVNTVGATRKYANVVTGAQGQIQVKSIAQSSNSVLYRNLLDASAAVGKGNVISNGLDRISETLGDTDLSRSPSALITKLGDALNTLAASPNSYELARSAVSAASDLVTSLNDASLTVQTIRRDADNELVLAAADINKILANIEDLNLKVVAGTRTGADVTDLSDQRDQAVVALSSYIGVTAQLRGDNDLVLYTDSGVTLFETKARAVEYSATPGLNESVSAGNAFRIDGTAVTGDLAYLPLKSGSVAGLVALRDDVLVTYQTQLDEIARGLVTAFAETSSTGAASTGLFTAAGVTGPAKAAVGAFDAGQIAAGDVLTFDFVAGDKSYRATHTFTGPADATTYQGILQAAIDAATPVGGGAALGAGKVTVESGGGVLTLSANTAGVLGISVSNIKTFVGAKDGGLAAATLATGTTAPDTPATIAIGTFDAGTIAVGDKLAFQFVYDGQAYSASHTFTGAPADAAAFQAILQNAIETAVPVAGGAVLGTGKITVGNAAGALSLATVASGSSKSLSLSNITTVPANLSQHTGGLSAGVSTTVVPGLANLLRLGAGVAADPTKLRDGVVNDYNTANAGGFTARLNQLTDALGATRNFSATSEADPSASLADFAASSVSWLQANRQESLSQTEYKTTLQEQTQKALSNATGINMDEQLTQLIEIERSYQASSKLISTIGDMLQSLLDAI